MCVCVYACMRVHVRDVLSTDELRGGSLTIRNISVLSTCLPAVLGSGEIHLIKPLV